MNSEMRQLILMRHGPAEALAARDEARALTEQGREEVLGVAHWLKDRQVLATGVVSSPYLRARQTAALVASVLGLAVLPQDSRLVPSGDAYGLAADLMRPGESAFCVLHMPLIAALVQALTGQEVYPGTSAVFSIAMVSPVMGQNVLQWSS